LRISSLYADSVVRGQDCYVVGLGPSMSVFPRQMLVGRTCVLLNDAQRHFPELGPIAFSNHRDFVDPIGPEIKICCVKGRLKSDPNPERDDNHVPWDDPVYHVFSYRTFPYDEVDIMDEKTLWREPDYYWRGPVAVFACQFLLLAGARSITLVGCDCGPIAGEDYCKRDVEVVRRAAAKTTDIREWNLPLRHNYQDYAYGLIRLKQDAELRFKVPIVSMTPFIGFGDPAAQLKAIRRWRGEPIGKSKEDKELEHRQRRIMGARARRLRQNRLRG
jgi:hypothetical protein